MIYRPPSSSITLFLQEMADLLLDITIHPGKMLILGDFKLHYETGNASGVPRLHELLMDNNLKQYVDELTHQRDHMVDLVITRPGDRLIENVKV